MKKFMFKQTLMFLISVIGIICSSFTTDKLNYTNHPNQQLIKELIIEIPQLTEKNISDIKTTISKFDGVLYQGMCFKKKVLMFHVDTQIQPDYSFLDIVSSSFNVTINIKTGASINQVNSLCGSNYDNSGNPQ
ncbi:MAG: hypothetical protein Fur0041_19800 [Bacteroidia bacterium]